jgi:hypothetical protein
MAEQVGQMPLAERTATLTDRRAYGTDITASLMA